MLMTLLHRRSALAVPLAVTLARPALGQGDWPTRPLRIIVPFGTGGGTDITTRLLAQRLSEILGQPVVVENRPGAGGTLGADFVAKSPPNGDTFLLATVSNMALAIGLYSRLPYDPVRDLLGVAPTVYIPIGMAASTKLGAANAAEFTALLRANPGRYSFGSAGAGTSGHIASSAFLSRIGATAEHVPYRNPGQTFLALQQGEIAFTIVRKMAGAIEQALSDPAISRRFDEMGTPAMRGWTPERFADFLRSEIELWVPLVRASGARAD
jgi:tripartite-type tricarboxylate transporter receptor subunit TctC